MAASILASMVYVYGYSISLLLLVIISLFKGVAHFTYCRREDPGYYEGYDSFLEAFSPFKWSISLQLIMLPFWPSADEAASDELQKLMKRIKWLVAISWGLYAIAFAPAVILLVVLLNEAHQ